MLHKPSSYTPTYAAAPPILTDTLVSGDNFRDVIGQGTQRPDRGGKASPRQNPVLDPIDNPANLVHVG